MKILFKIVLSTNTKQPFFWTNDGHSIECKRVNYSGGKKIPYRNDYKWSQNVQKLSENGPKTAMKWLQNGKIYKFSIMK